MRFNILALSLTLAMTCALLFPLIASSQSFGARENNMGYNGTRLTYYQRASVDQCQADCATNPNCQGYTWIQAGTYNANDAAMCYLMSAVTARAAARGHISAVKAGPVGGGGGGLYAGKWHAYSFGECTLEQNGTRVTGRYIGGSGIAGPGSIEGVVRGDQLYFAWRADNGQEGQAIWYPWNKNFAGKICGTGRGCIPDGYQEIHKR